MSFEKLHEIDIDRFIKEIWQSLRDSHELISGGNRFDEYMQQLREGIASGDITDDWIQAALIDYLASSPFSSEYPFRRAAVLVELTQQARDKGDTLAFLALALKASAAVESASVHAEFNSMIDVPAALKRRSAVAGAEASNAKLQPAKDYAITLIIERRPHQGWEDLTHAVQSIEKELSDFIHNQRISLSRERIRTTIKRWYKEDDNFRDALNAIIPRSR